MAEDLTLQGVNVKVRNPWGVWAASILTLGISELIHWNRINIELRDYSAAVGRPFRNNPNLAVLALLAGALLLIPFLLTLDATVKRVQALQRMTAPPGRIVEVVSPGKALLVCLLGLHVVYLQKAMNECWESGHTAGAPVASSTPSPIGTF